MHFHRLFFFVVILISLVPLIFSDSVFAAGTISRSDLRLELLLATGSSDTNGLPRVVTSSGVGPIFMTDATYGVPYANFVGSGGLKVNTSWSSSVDNFTVSFWIKHSGNFITGSTLFSSSTKKIRKEGGCPSCASDYRDEIYISNIAQTIFTSGDDGGTKMIIDSSGKCGLRGGMGTSLTQSTFLGSIRNPAGLWTNLYKYEYKIFDAGTNLQESFNCSALLNNKWHHVLLIRRSNTLSLTIDNVEAAKISTTPLSIGRNITLGYSDLNTSLYSSVFTANEMAYIANTRYLRGNIAGFRLYSRALTDTELESLSDEFRYAQSELSGTGNIQISMDRYVIPSIFVNFKNIPLTLSKDKTVYEYALDGKTFTSLTDITDISTGTGFLDYRVGIDLSGKPDGRMTLTFRARGGNQSIKNLGTVAFTKLDNATTITIVMPSTEIDSSKTITAFATGAQLSMFVTSGTTCDATSPGFEDYSDLTFTNKIDNGKRVCYRAYYSALNKTIYKLSSTIQGIQSLDEKTTAISTKLFDTYLLWTKSNYPKLTDTATLVLDLLSVAATSSNGTINGVTMTDINGDGLVDFLYSRNDPVRRAIIVNNGNYTFKTVYRCAADQQKDAYGNIIAGGMTTYYGDCADSTR